MPQEHPLLSAKMLAVLAVLGVLWGGGMALILADRLPAIGIVMGFMASAAIVSLYAKPLRQAWATGEWEGPEMPSKTELIIAVVCTAVAPVILIYLYLFPAVTASVPAEPKPPVTKKEPLRPVVVPPARPAPSAVATQTPKEHHTINLSPGADWKVQSITFDPPFDATKQDATYRVRVAAQNIGTGASSNPNVRNNWYIGPKRLTRQELDEQFSKVAAVPVDTDFLSHTAPSLEHGEGVFEDVNDPVAQAKAQQVISGAVKLYLLAIISWIDTGTPKGMYRTAEFCGIMTGGSTGYSLCDYHNTLPVLKRLPVARHPVQAQPETANSSPPKSSFLSGCVADWITPARLSLTMKTFCAATAR